MPETGKNGVKNYDRELGAIDAKINFLEKKFERYEIDTAIKLKDIKEQNEKLEKKMTDQTKELETQFKGQTKELEEKMTESFKTISDKIDTLKYESTFSKGFIKATLLYGSIIGVIITIALKFIK